MDHSVELLKDLSEEEKRALFDIVGTRGWDVLIKILEEKQVRLISLMHTSSSGEEALSRIKLSEGFRQVFEILVLISSREEYDEELHERMAEVGQGGGRKYVRSIGSGGRTDPNSIVAGNDGNAGSGLRSFPYGY
jgi:hypothetical protein